MGLVCTQNMYINRRNAKKDFMYKENDMSTKYSCYFSGQMFGQILDNNESTNLR